MKFIPYVEIGLVRMYTLPCGESLTVTLILFTSRKSRLQVMTTPNPDLPQNPSYYLAFNMSRTGHSTLSRLQV